MVFHLRQLFVAGDSSEGLLPSGLTDLLAPQAEQDAKAVEAVLSCFASFGYKRIKPPLVEFEQTLLAEGLGLLWLTRHSACLTQYRGE